MKLSNDRAVRASLVLVVAVCLSVCAVWFGPVNKAAGSDENQPAEGSPDISGSIVVTNANDSGSGSLRQAILDAPDGGTIGFEPTFFATPRTITLAGFDLTISKNLTINGLGADRITVSGAGLERVFRVTSTATINGLTITGGAPGLSNGGGISNGGILTVSNCHITGNTANFGGGISNTASGNLTVINSTISGNTSNERGGGIDSTGMLTVVNSTVSGNVTLDTGGQPDGGGISTRSANIINSTITNNTVTGAGSASGLIRDSGSVSIINSIIAKNVNNAAFPDVVTTSGGGISSDGYNIIGNRGTIVFANTGDQAGDSTTQIDPLIGSLLMNGGGTPTHALRPDSPALDKGTNFGYLTDQRGLVRPVDLPIVNAIGGDGSDIGAFEAQTVPVEFTITGRVFSFTGLAIRNQVVFLTETATNTRRTATTSTFGVYTFTGVAPGNYIVSVNSKRYRFAPVNLMVTENVNDLNLSGLE